MTKKLARVGDEHLCLAHAGGPVSGGAAMVIAEGVGAARLADPAACRLGPTDIIASGSSMVLIHGLPAAGLSDRTLHAGAIMGGAAQVLIGGPTFSVPANIAIEGDADFQNKVVRDLYFLSTTRTGSAILARMERLGRPVAIVPVHGPNNTSPNFKDGSSVISYDPDGVVVYPIAGKDVPVAPQLGLAHELIHAIQIADGSARDNFYWPEGVPKHDELLPRELVNETAVIGIGEHANDKVPDAPTENQLLRDLGMPPRETHRAKPGSSGPNHRPGKP